MSKRARYGPLPHSQGPPPRCPHTQTCRQEGRASESRGGTGLTDLGSLGQRGARNTAVRVLPFRGIEGNPAVRRPAKGDEGGGGGRGRGDDVGAQEAEQSRRQVRPHWLPRPLSPMSCGAHLRVSLEVSLVKRLVVGRGRPVGRGAASWASVGEAGGPFCTPPPPPPPARRSRTWPPWKVLRMVEPRARRLRSPDGGARL